MTNDTLHQYNVDIDPEAIHAVVESYQKEYGKTLDEGVVKKLAPYALAALGSFGGGLAAHNGISNAVDSAKASVQEHKEAKAEEYVEDWMYNKCDRAELKDCADFMGLSSDVAWVLPKIGDKIEDNGDGTYSTRDGSRDFGNAIEVFTFTRNLLNSMSQALHQRYALNEPDGEDPDYDIEIGDDLTPTLVINGERMPLRMEYKNGQPVVRCATCSDGGESMGLSGAINKTSLYRPTKGKHLNESSELYPGEGYTEGGYANDDSYAVTQLANKMPATAEHEAEYEEAGYDFDWKVLAGPYGSEFVLDLRDGAYLIMTVGHIRGESDPSLIDVHDSNGDVIACGGVEEIQDWLWRNYGFNVVG